MNDVEGHFWESPRRGLIWTKYHALVGYLALLTAVMAALVLYQIHVNRESKRADERLAQREYAACLVRNEFRAVLRAESMWVGNILKAEAMRPRQIPDMVALWSAVANQELYNRKVLRLEFCK